MKVELHAVEEMTLEAFADKYGLTMQVHERSRRDLPRYWAALHGVEVSDGHFLTSASGNGETPEEAIADYVPRISEQHIVLRAFCKNRQDIYVPRLIPRP